eukprot:4671066-Karenia_brevis.AAC.1
MFWIDENGEFKYVYEDDEGVEVDASPNDYLDEAACAELAAHEEEDSRASGIDLHRALSTIPASALVAAASAVPKGDACRPSSTPRSAVPPE